MIFFEVLCILKNPMVIVDDAVEVGLIFFVIGGAEQFSIPTGHVTEIFRADLEKVIVIR